MAYPSDLKAMATRLSNYSSRVRKVTPLGKDNGYKAGAMHFTASTKADVASDGKGVVLLPSLPTSLIDQIVISCSGVQIEATTRQWNQLAKMLDDFTAGSEKRRARVLLNNERLAGLNVATSDFWGNKVESQGDIAGAYPTVSPGARETNRRLIIDKWPGCFIGTVNPSVISTALTGDMMIEFRFAPNSVLVSSKLAGYAPAAGDEAYVERMDIDGEEIDIAAGNTTAMPAGKAAPVGAHHLLDDVFLSVKTCDISDGKFYDWLKSEISSEALMLPFQHFVMQPGQLSAAGSCAQTTRMTVNNSSVDILLGTFQG
jgi:hypothetical protein